MKGVFSRQSRAGKMLERLNYHNGVRSISLWFIAGDSQERREAFFAKLKEISNAANTSKSYTEKWKTEQIALRLIEEQGLKHFGFRVQVVSIRYQRGGIEVRFRDQDSVGGLDDPRNPLFAARCRRAFV